MHPIERLRYIARSEGDAGKMLAIEAAWTLSELASIEPSALLTACRRLLDRRPECGQLWWIGAHLLLAADPFAASRRLVAELCSDPAPSVLAASLRRRLRPGVSLASAPPLELLRDALELRRGASVRVVAEQRELRPAIGLLSQGADEVAGFGPGAADDALRGAGVVVVEALAAGPFLVLVSPAAAALAHEAFQKDIACWLVLGAGAVIAEPLIAAAAAAATRAGTAEVLSPDEFRLGIDCVGEGDPGEVLARASCPAGLELLGRRGP
ncbi:MAG: hypothetical protein ACRDZ5_08390 [Acidimicrobiales bacterium]